VEKQINWGIQDKSFFVIAKRLTKKKKTEIVPPERSLGSFEFSDDICLVVLVTQIIVTANSLTPLVIIAVHLTRPPIILTSST